MAKKISIVIVSYNVREILVECIDSVRKALEGIDGEMIVVDNCSKDDTVSFLQTHCTDVRLIANQENTIRGCLDFMDAHPEAGGAGVRMLTREGNPAPESRRAIPTPWVAMLKMLGFTRRYYMSDLPWDEPCQIEVVSGAYCPLRRKALDQIGLLDEDFFMYGEDIDLSYRMIHGGWQNWYLPYDIIHYKGESTQKSSFRYVHVFYQAMLIFFRKHYSHLSFLLSLPIQAAIYFRATLALIPMLGDRLRHFINPSKNRHKHD